MFARVWWKEYRAFGPAWLILGVAAGLLQWLFVSVNALDTRGGALTVAALAWAVLYAFASGASAFASEREAKTLGFLDALPVGRGTLWAGKASFALASTFGLALALAGMAALGTGPRDPEDIYGYDRLVRVSGTVLFEAVAWSLLWSSMSGNSLLAGVMGVLSVYVVSIAVDVTTSRDNLPGDDYTLATIEAMPWRLLVALGAVAASGLVMTWKPTGRKPPRKVEPRPEPTIAIRASSAGRSLIWQARREGLTTWVLVAIVGLALPVVAGLLAYPSDGLFELVLAVLASLVAGVSVFGSDNATGGRRFLVDHGVAPGTVWWRRLLIWAVAIGSIFGLGMLASGALGKSPPNPGVPGPIGGLALLNGFAVGLVCGMTITRRITAVLVGVIVLVAVLPLQLGAALNGMVPSWTVFLVPMIFVATSRAWAGDWLLEREGPRPWLRLAGCLVVPFAVLGVVYIEYRAYALPDVGPQFVGVNLQVPTIPPDQDAAEACRRAAASIRPEWDLFNADNRTRSPSLEAVLELGWDTAQVQVVRYWTNNQAAIDLARKASMLPRGRFEDVSRMTASRSTLPNDLERTIRDMEAIGQLLALDARERLARGDLPGAWADILALFRIAGQLGADSPTTSRILLAARVDQRAVGLAFDWLGAANPKAEAVLKALADLKALPPVPNLAATMQVESAIIERTLDLPVDDLAGNLLVGPSSRKPSTTEYLWFGTVVAPPWERQRARRACRFLIARELPEVVLEPYRRGPNPNLRSMQDSDYWQNGWNLTRMVLPYFEGVVVALDREVVGRRALEQAIAIEVWKLGHDGQYPETLDVLVPGLLPRLPLDPYSGRPFGYARSGGQDVFPPFNLNIESAARPRATRPGQPLLYSFGPDQADNKGQSYSNGTAMNIGDYVYPVP